MADEKISLEQVLVNRVTAEVHLGAGNLNGLLTYQSLTRPDVNQ
jgi:hypothetical protein